MAAAFCTCQRWLEMDAVIILNNIILKMNSLFFLLFGSIIPRVLPQN